MEIKHGMPIISMTTTGILNSLTVPRIEMKLGTHASNIICMTITLFEQEIFLKITSSLLKLAKGSTHVDETWYTCVLHHFHVNYMFL